MKTFSRNDWITLINKLDKSKIRLLRDTYNTPGEMINIRHDVDDDIQSSVAMAEREALNGIKATYFILNTAPYWESPGLLDYIKSIADMGHEIGWHNNAITENLKTGKPLEQCIGDPLATLRKVAPVTGTASHGDHLCHELRYLNYYAFYETKKNPAFTSMCGMVFSLRYFELEYEAYHTGHELYLSESGGTWGTEPDEVLSEFNKGGKKLQILIHPQWWE